MIAAARAAGFGAGVLGDRDSQMPRGNALRTGIRILAINLAITPQRCNQGYPRRMTLARKHSRIVRVDGVRYRWTVANRRDPEVTIVVEHAETPGRRMITGAGLWCVATPAVVRRAIRLARAEGWDPAGRGPEFRLVADLPYHPLKTP